jgi:uncharacterized cofD-like protein
MFIAAMAAVTGSFERGVVEAARLLSVNGEVLPSTLHDVRLVADLSLPYLQRDVRVEGESRIPKHPGQVRRIWLEPNTPPAFPPTIQAILAAEMIVVGPGSLYTSLLPNLLVPHVAEAIRASRAFKVFVCNVATQSGETDDYTCYDHVRTVDEHVGSGLFDLVVVNTNWEGVLPPGVQWVQADERVEGMYPVYGADFTNSDQPSRHDPKKLAQALIDLLQERTGPLVE